MSFRYSIEAKSLPPMRQRNRMYSEVFRLIARRANMPYRFAVALLCASFATLPLVAEGDIERLQDVKTIFVGSFGDGPGGELIRSKVVSYLVKSKRIDVVESPDSADAVLTGAGELSKTEHYSANANSSSAK